MQKKINIYVCSGCEIGNSIDINDLKWKICEKNAGVNFKQHSFLCGNEGIKEIKNDIEKGGAEAVILAACSSRVKNNEFQLSKEIITERVNFREQLAWCQKPGNEDTQMLAEDLLNMAIAKVKVISTPKPFIANNLNSDLLVLGGGIAGLTSAIEASKAGYNVILIEKSNTLGGWSNNLHKQIPDTYPYTELKDPIIVKRIEEVKRSNNIRVFTSSEIIEISGQPGAFKVKFLNNPSEHSLTVGAIVIATGWTPYDPLKLDYLGYGKSENIITSIQFEEMVKNNNIHLPSNNKIPEKVLFVQCAGSRDKDHLPYCSNYCCLTTLKQTRYITESLPGTSVFIVYKDIRTPGNYEQFYQSVQNHDQVFFTKGDIQSIHHNKGKIKVEIKNTLLDKLIDIDVDLVVLAVGMTPSNSQELNLKYRQGKGLPTLKYEFPDSHFICFPYETRRTGIYAAGTCRAPMDIPSSMEDAEGATLKAIQCIEAVKKGEAVHPRSGDTSYPELFLQRCTDCKRCTEECPFGAYDETEKGTPLPNPNRCRRCGICLGSCPERIINFVNFSIESISAMIKAINIPDEFEEKPRVLAFVCENDAYPAFDMAGMKRLQYSAFLRIIPVRCIGSVNKIWITDALSHGFDGILLFGCKPGDDNQCHFILGSELTKERSENFQESLQTMMLEPERIKAEFIEINDYYKIPEIINNFIEDIELIGPNPFKSM